AVGGDLTDEANPASMHGLDESGPAGIVPEDAADLADAHGERRLAHRHIGPHGGEELVLRHELTRSGHQEIQYGEGLRRESTHAFPAPQPEVRGVEAKLAEPETVDRVAGRHWRLSPDPRTALRTSDGSDVMLPSPPRS